MATAPRSSWTLSARAVADGVGMLAAGGSYYVVGYGDTLSVPTIQMVLTETSFIGNLVRHELPS
jgi:hypothetical protein